MLRLQCAAWQQPSSVEIVPMLVLLVVPSHQFDVYCFACSHHLAPKDNPGIYTPRGEVPAGDMRILHIDADDATGKAVGWRLGVSVYKDLRVHLTTLRSQ